MSGKSISALEIKRILSARVAGEFSKLSEIPKPHLFKDADKAADRIVKAIQKGEKITVVGDYDVDGVTSTVIMIDFFKQINYPLQTIIPNRFRDGYGVSAQLLDRIDADVIITVDNGVNAFDAATIAKQRGIDLIITDHHTPSETLPDAFAIVNPKQEGCAYPFKEICGAQVAWLFLALVKQKLNAKVDMGSFLDLLAIAIIADVMPLIGMNRVMVQRGLAMIPHSVRPSMQALSRFLDKTELSSEDIGFQIAPRLNSAGRMEDASYAVEFLSAQNEEEAFLALEKLDRLNRYRKDIEAQATKEAMLLADEHESVIVVAKQGWHEGVVGIVAARLVDHFQKPAIVLSIEKGVAKGSARSLGEVNLHELLTESEAYLLKYGGHKMAAGLSLEEAQIDRFRHAINEEAKKLTPDMFIAREELLGELYAKDINFDLVEMIESFQPFGEANPRPKFLMKNVKANFVKRFGEDNAHLRFSVDSPHEEYGLGVVAFRSQERIENGERISLSFVLNKNEFKGRTSIQLMLDRVYN